MTRNPKITKSQMRGFVGDYHRLLPGWEQISAEIVARSDGPLMQCIGFEAMRGGDYRPMHFVDVFVTPEKVGFFHQFLKKWPGELLPRQHKEYHRRMFENMKHEFRPSITEAFDARTAFDLCEKKAIPRSHEAYALAALNAYFGRDDRARYWCALFPRLVEEGSFPWQPWNLREKAFLDSLEDWLNTGEAKFRLQEILKERRKKEGFA
jgi:hypothetical protein